MLSVHLYDLAFYAFHGAYEGEAKAGNDFRVDLTVRYDEKKVKLDSLDAIISYEVLYEIVKKRMAITTLLLEEVAEAIILKIRHQYPVSREISISIFKLQPPISGFMGRAGITLQKHFDD